MVMINENFQASGELFIRKYDANMVLTEEIHVPNKVVTTGTAYIAQRILNNSTAVMSHMAIGTNNVAAIAGNTTLGAEISRKAFDTSGSSTNTVTYSATFVPGVGTGALTEAGIFNAASIGTMLCRTVFGVVTKGVSDTVTITWVITSTAA
jgi:hypothetical protein